jgi:hypothetical protein
VLSSLANCVLVQRILFTDRNGRKRNAPGVTGVRLSQSELNKLGSATKAQAEKSTLLIRVLAECAAENLLLAKPSAASTSRESGTVFYLNRTLCAHYDLPLQQGGWQDVTAAEMIDWMERGAR